MECVTFGFKGNRQIPDHFNRVGYIGINPSFFPFFFCFWLPCKLSADVVTNVRQEVGPSFLVILFNSVQNAVYITK